MKERTLKKLTNEQREKLVKEHPETFRVIFEQLSELIEKSKICEFISSEDLKDKSLNEDNYYEYLLDENKEINKLGISFSIILSDKLFSVKLDYYNNPICYFEEPNISINSFEDILPNSDVLTKIIKDNNLYFSCIKYKYISLYLLRRN